MNEQQIKPRWGPNDVSKDLSLYQPAPPIGEHFVSWQDVERLACVDPVVHQYVTLVQRGDLTQEEALIRMAHFQYVRFKKIFDSYCNLVMSMPQAPLILRESEISNPSGL